MSRKRNYKMEFEAINIQQICRICEKVESEMISVFQKCEHPYENLGIDEMLMTCATIQVICGDGLPQQICRACIKQLTNAFAFKEQCEKADTNLRQARNQIDNDMIHIPQTSDCMDDFPSIDVVLKTETPDDQFMETEQLLTCKQCLETFTSMKDLLHHQRDHRDVIYQCSKCDKKYTRLKPFQKHEQSHNQKKSYVCKVCCQTLTRLDHLWRHLRTHLKKKPFPCTTCNRTFSRVDNLQTHIPKCTRDLVYSCDMCSMTFRRQDSLELHKKKHVGQGTLPTIDNLDNVKDHYHVINDVNIVFSDDSDEDNRAKSVNDKGSNVSETPTVNNCDSNVNNVTEEFIDVNAVKVENDVNDTVQCSDFVSVKVENDAGSSVASSRFLCSECGLSFARNDNLVIHMRRHTGEKPFKCQFCEKGFVRLTDVMAHERCHTGEKPHLCTVCGKSFKWVYNLKMHMKTHSKAKSYECSYCDAVFTQCEDFERHLQSHEVKDFQRQYGKRFLSGHPLSEQTQTVSSVSKKKKATSRSEKCVERKIHKCTICGKEFGKLFYLTVHMKSHNSKTDV